MTQPKSTSSNNPGLLTIAADSLLQNGSSLVWGDNNKTLTNADKIPGVPVMLKQQWLMVTRNNDHPLTTEVILDTRQLDVPLPPKPVYWLAIDSSGKGDFSQPGVQFVRMNSLDKDGKAHFSSIAWGGPNHPTDIMGVSVAQDLLAVASITNPTCGDPKSGSIKVKIVGGLAPFQLVLTKTTGEAVYHAIINANKTEKIEGLPAAKYQLTLTDAHHATYTDSFYLNNADGPKPLSIATNYTLPQSGALTLQADSGQTAEGLHYEWNGPNGFHSTNPGVTLTHPGTYTLKCDNNGCSYQQDIEINGFDTGILNKDNVKIYPNTSTGPFTATVNLDMPRDVRMTVYGLDGRQWGDSQAGTGMANYVFKTTIPAMGIYIMEFVSGKYRYTRKIVVIN